MQVQTEIAGRHRETRMNGVCMVSLKKPIIKYVTFMKIKQDHF
jgi:hypothetical protein